MRGEAVYNGGVLMLHLLRWYRNHHGGRVRLLRLFAEHSEGVVERVTKGGYEVCSSGSSRRCWTQS